MQSPGLEISSLAAAHWTVAFTRVPVHGAGAQEALLLGAGGRTGQGAHPENPEGCRKEKGTLKPEGGALSLCTMQCPSSTLY